MDPEVARLEALKIAVDLARLNAQLEPEQIVKAAETFAAFLTKQN